MGSFLVAMKNYDVEYWQERDRIQLTLTCNSVEVFTLWDDAVIQAIEDGYLNPNHLLSSCVWYATFYLGIEL